MKYVVTCSGFCSEERVVEADSPEEAKEEAIKGEYEWVLCTEPYGMTADSVEPYEEDTNETEN